MCGLIGRIGAAGSAESLRNAVPLLARRGPDSQRLWSTPDARVALLHGRLAIVDRDSRAHQPLTDAEAGVTVAHVGEIYNYRALRAEFARYAFRTESDTEVILASYVLHGLGGLAKLKGMFAFAIVDERAERAFIARDAVGKKPLLIARWGGTVYFGTSARAMLAAYGSPVAPDRSCAQFYWENEFPKPGAGPLDGVEHLLPGEVAEFAFDGRLLSRRRVAPAVAATYQGEPFEAAVETVAALIDKAIERRLDNNPSPIALLSGGIDSTIVCARAQHVGRRLGLQVKALTLASFLSHIGDERHARFAARQIGIPLQRVTVHLDQLSVRIQNALQLQDEPLAMPSFFLLERLVEAASQHGRVLMTGDGGDEIFLGYGRARDWQSTQGRAQSDEVPTGTPSPAWMSSWGRQMATLDLVGHGFAKVDRSSAEQGVEVRCPFLDWDVVAYARSLPYEFLARGDQNKAILKAMLADWPAHFVHRRKSGFAFNLRWLWLIEGFAGLRESVEHEAMETFVDRIPAALRGKPNGWSTLAIMRNFRSAWKLMVWSSFLRRFDSTRAGRV